MGQKYEQLSLEQRCTIARYGQAGKTIRKIAAAMDRAPSTIARELKRNRGAKVGYQPVYAEQQAKSRRWRGSRLRLPCIKYKQRGTQHYKLLSSPPPQLAARPSCAPPRSGK